MWLLTPKQCIFFQEHQKIFLTQEKTFEYYQFFYSYHLKLRYILLFGYSVYNLRKYLKQWILITSLTKNLYPKRHWNEISLYILQLFFCNCHRSQSKTPKSLTNSQRAHRNFIEENLGNRVSVNLSFASHLNCSYICRLISDWTVTWIRDFQMLVFKFY